MPRAGLTTSAVVAAGAALADDTGWDSLTLAALAKRLGVRQPSLYKHVSGLPALRREIRLLALRELREVMAAAAVGRSGPAALVTMARAYRGYARTHPGRYAASVGAPPAGDAELGAAGAAVVGTVEAVLSGFGLTGADAVHAIRGLRSVIHGFVGLELAGGFALPQDLDESYDRLVAGFAGSLAPTPAASDARTVPAGH
jgi:AcrR family transcriptional regulator